MSLPPIASSAPQNLDGIGLCGPPSGKRCGGGDEQPHAYGGNLGGHVERFNATQKNHRESLAESWRESSRTLPVRIEVPTEDEIWDAAVLKGRYPIAYADAFAVALAQKHRCPLVTGDPELQALSDLELDWIGCKA
jgi:hypothetical protein